MTCRVCHADYHPSRFSADDRCGLCRSRGRWWTREQLGSRAQVHIVNRESALYGLTGIGTRVSAPVDGWQVRLLESPERSLYFGGASVEVDWEIPRLREPERPMLMRMRRNGRELTGGKTATTPNASISGPATRFLGRP